MQNRPASSTREAENAGLITATNYDYERREPVVKIMIVQREMATAIKTDALRRATTNQTQISYLFK